MTYRPTIGIEVHAELATRTKMFCDCKNDPDATEPNVNICPVCLAHPGTLPVPNKAAIEHVLRVGTAIGGTLADYSEFDRKSYFYPDIPKGYQISQYAYPFVSGGTLAEVAITRVHLEEDTARSSHEGEGDTSLVDFNRAGVPLMELVTEPDIHDAETAGAFARELQLLLRSLGASEANLEKGEMRIEANISVSKDDELGTKVEVKNLNSFRSVERAIAYEVDRQSKLLDEGGKVVQETRGWNEAKQETFSQRLKEGSADYRYFPEPDLPKMKRSEIDAWQDAVLAETLPELPAARRTRYAELGIKDDDATTLAMNLEVARFFDEVLAKLGDATKARTAANYLISDVAGRVDALSADAFSELVRMIDAGEVSSRGAKDTLAILVERGGTSARAAAEELGVLQVNDTETLRAQVREVIAANEAAVAEYRGGKEAALQFLLGASMKATKGAGNPKVLRELLVSELATS